MNHSFGKIIRILVWPILFEIGQFLIVAILTLVFMQKQVDQMKLVYPTETEQQIIERVNQLDLSVPLNDYMESHLIYVVLINAFVFVPILMHQYGKTKQKRKQKLTFSPFLILSPIAFCLLFHIPLIGMGVRYEVTNTSYFWILVMSEGIVGPILEEYLFRGVVYQKLKALYSTKNAMIFCTILFALFHDNLLQIVFALLLGTILILLYEKYQDIKVPILFHSIVNLVSLLLIPHLQNIHYLFTIVLFLLSGICFYWFCRKESFFGQFNIEK